MMEKRRNVIPLYSMKLRDAVRPTCHLVVTCWTCKRVDTLDVVDLIVRFGPLTRLSELERKTMRCRGCDGTANTLRVEWIEG